MIEEVPVEVVELIRTKPIVAYQFMASLCSQALMHDGIKHDKSDVDIILYNYLDGVKATEVKKEDIN